MRVTAVGEAVTSISFGKIKTFLAERARGLTSG
jgi:hypothetical protein